MSSKNTTLPVQHGQRKSGGRLLPRSGVLPRFKNRPPAIREALQIVAEKAGDLELSRSSAAVMQAIIATGVSVDSPTTPIFARKSTLARLADVGVRSVYRALKQFEALGFIIRQDQARNREGCLDVSEIVLTGDFLRQLRLMVHNSAPQPTNQNKSEQQQTNNTIVNSSGQLCATVYNNSAFEPTQCASPRRQKLSTENPRNLSVCPGLAHGLAHGTVYKDQDFDLNTVNNQSPAAMSSLANRPQSAYVRYQGRSIARELFWLIEEKRLTLSGLFWLQREAGKIGQRLSDFVALRAERLKQLASDGDCFRYLRALIHQNMDAAYMLNLRSKKEIAQKKAEEGRAGKAYLAAQLEKYNGKRLIDPTSGTIVEIYARAQLGILLAADGHTSLGAISLTGAMLKGILEGKWKEFFFSGLVPRTEKLRRAG